WGNAAMDFSVSGITYDLNGNILTMNQRGQERGSTPYTIDSLQYTYKDGGNKLVNVQDRSSQASASPIGDFWDGNDHTATLADDYGYDDAGNLVQDANKKIAAITYNLHNKPVTILFEDNTYFRYVYDAAGNK